MRRANRHASDDSGGHRRLEPSGSARHNLYGTKLVRREVSLTESAWGMLQERYGGDNYNVTVRNALLRLVELENRQAAES